MRNWICILLSFWSGMTCIAQEGTRFETLTLQEALKKAEREGKKVFVDCYTKTCGPCKYMVKYIFPLKACGDYFNAHYVCIMVDTQEGEGIEIAKKYRVQMHPTYLILNTDGTLFCSLMGGVSRPEDDFVQKVKNQVKLTEMNQQFAKGKRERVDELLKLLARLEQELPCSQERIAVLKELNGVERFATPEQKKAIVDALQTLSKHFQTAEKEQLEQLMLKLRN